MKNEKRKAAMAILKQEIQKHQRNLEQLLMLETDVVLENGNYVPKGAQGYIDLEQVKTDKERLLITISDLMTIYQALKRNKTETNIRGTARSSGMIYMTTADSIQAAGLETDGDGYGKIYFW